MAYNYVSNDVGYRYIVLNVLYGRALNLMENLVAQRQGDDTSRRPLFFIAHSLGGWIVKRALILSSEAADLELKSIGSSTCGVAFFGTISPGRPSSPSPLAHVIRRTSSCADESKAHAPSMQLQASDIEWLERQMAAFKGITSNLPKLSFYETKKTDNEFVAERKHSMTSSDGTQIGLSSTHSDLIRFWGRDANYKAFITHFRDMVEKAFATGLSEARRRAHDVAAGKTIMGLETTRLTDITLVRRLDLRNSGYKIPYQILDDSDASVPRTNLLEQIDAVFCPPVSAHKTTSFRIIHLWGTNGMGKTSLAKHYAELHKHELSFVFWISAESWETAAASYLDFAKTMVDHYSRKAPRAEVESELGLSGIEEMTKAKNALQVDRARVMSVLRAVKDWLMQPENSRWLVVVDHIVPSYDIHEFIPLTLSGKILLTSRDVTSCTWGTKIEIAAMSETEAVEMLRTSAGLSVDRQSTERKLLDYDRLSHTNLTVEETEASLVKRLECHPVRISQAASTIRFTRMTLSEYLRELDEKAMPRIFGSAIDQFPMTRTILRVSAMLSSSAIPTALFNAQLKATEVPSRFTRAISEIKCKSLPQIFL